MNIEAMVLHDMPYVVVTEPNHPKDRGFACQRCTVCGMSSTSSTIHRERADTYDPRCTTCGDAPTMRTIDFVTTDAAAPPTAYPAASWDDVLSQPKAGAEQCDCLETAVDYYRQRHEVLYSDGDPVLTERDVRVLDALLDIQDGKPRKPRHQ